MGNGIHIKIVKDGPYVLRGVDEISRKIIECDENNAAHSYKPDGSFKISSSPALLCRCGKTLNAPFCDNSHIKFGFDGTENADISDSLENVISYQGKNLKLYDNEKLCALARFCDAKGSVWNLILSGRDEDDKEAVKQANLCPSGRLMIFDNAGNPLEFNHPTSVSLLEDKGFNLSGAIYVSGEISIESSCGNIYLTGNRRTLCRCGGSANKPFCDCTHFYIKFKANYPED